MAIDVSVQPNGRFLPGTILLLLPSENSFKCHKEVLYWQPMLRRSRCVQFYFVLFLTQVNKPLVE